MDKLDLRCNCRRCIERTEETYELYVSCYNCGWEGIAIIRKGDKPNLGEECPNCEVSYRLNFKDDPKYTKKKRKEIFNIPSVNIPSVWINPYKEEYKYSQIVTTSDSTNKEWKVITIN